MGGAWHIHLTGKTAFGKEIEDDAFMGRPAIAITRMTGEGDVVAAEGTVRSARRVGGFLNSIFCDVLEMRNARITHMTHI